MAMTDVLLGITTIDPKPVVKDPGAVDVVAEPVAIAVVAQPGELVLDDAGRERKIKEITVGEDGVPRYKLDDAHDLVQIAEDKNEVTFQCNYCKRVVAFVLPGRGSPHVDGKPGAWSAPADHMKWMEKCST